MSENTPVPSEDKVSGWLLFAAMMMFGLGFFAFMAFLADILNNSWILDNTILGANLDWFWYGLFDGIIAIGSFYAGFALISRKVGGYVIGLIFATLSAGRWFLLIPAAPIWSIAMLVVWGLVIYALARNDVYPV